MNKAKITCASCGSVIEASSRFCPQCGAAAPAIGSPDTQDIEVSALLAGANLSRIRRNWVDAEEKCHQALKLAPNSASAHALLGDIYQNQNRHEEAAVWYQMASELDETNVGYRAKFEKAQSVLKARGALRDLDEEDFEASAKERAGWMEQFIRGENYRTLARILMIATAGVFLAVLIAGINGKIRQSRTSDRQATGSGSPAVSTPYPAAPQTSPSGSGVQYQRQPTQQSPDRTARQEAPAAPVSAFTPLETALLERVRRNPGVIEEKVSVAQAWADPRDQSITLVLQIPSFPAEQTRRIILQQARTAATAAFLAEPQAKQVVIRANQVMTDARGGSFLQIAFIGTLPFANSTQPTPTDATLEQLEKPFESIFWHPALSMKK